MAKRPPLTVVVNYPSDPDVYEDLQQKFFEELSKIVLRKLSPDGGPVHPAVLQKFEEIFMRDDVTF